MTNYEKMLAAKDIKEMAKVLCKAIADITPENDYICDYCPMAKNCHTGRNSHNGWVAWLEERA